MEKRNSTGGYIFLAVLAIVTLIAFTYLLKPPHDNSLGARVENAAEELSDGVRDAGRELTPNRTATDKIGDAVNDVGEDIKDAGSD